MRAPAQAKTRETAVLKEIIAVSYLRVSTTRQMETGADVDAEGNSIATQRAANNAKAAALGATVQAEFVEPGASAQSIEKRPIFKTMLAYLHDHPEVDVVIIYVRSRAFRNLGDAVLTKRKLDSLGVKLVSAKEDFGEGIMADAMEAVTDIINEVQVRMSGEDIRVKMKHKAEQGGTNGRAPVGYQNVRVDIDGRQVNTIALDPVRAPLIHKAFELYASGDYPLDRLQETMGDLGLTTRPNRRYAARPVSLAQLHRILRDPYYRGVVTYMGEEYPGKHEAIVDTDLFDKVQEIMNGRSRNGQRERRHHHYLKGLLWCGRCAEHGRTSRVIFTKARGCTGKVYDYFFCRGRQDGTCDMPYIPRDDMESAIADHYITLGIPKDFRTELKDAIHQAVADERSGVKELHAGYRKKLRMLDVREEKLLDLAEDGSLPREKIRTRLRHLHIERADLQQKLNETSEKLALGAETLNRYIALLEDPYGLYSTANDATRRELNQACFSRLWVDQDGVTDDAKTQPVGDLHDAVLAREERDNAAKPAEPERSTADEPETFVLADYFRGSSSKNALVPPTRLELVLDRV